ncbi:MAG: hypothetical protein ACR2QH_04680 [Geminicoccaceae bacterium]
MRKFLTIGAAGVALVAAGQAMAADTVITYTIQPTCDVTDLDDVTVNSANVGAANQALTQTEVFTVICDDAAGATLSLTTANGGLQNADDATIVNNYTAAVTGTGITTASLTTDGTAGATVPVVQTASADLANPANSDNATLTVTADAFAFSGTYSDTLTIDITAN